MLIGTLITYLLAGVIVCYAFIRVIKWMKVPDKPTQATHAPQKKEAKRPLFSLPRNYWPDSKRFGRIITARLDDENYYHYRHNLKRQQERIKQYLHG